MNNAGTELPVYLCGVSMGATTVLMAAGLDLPENVHGIMADCGFTSPHAIWKHVANNNLHIPFRLRGILADTLYERKTQSDAAYESTVDALRHCRIPVMLVHGADDHFVPLEMTYENYAACASPNLFIGILQEIRAKKTLDQLTMLNAPKAEVVRNGQISEIPAEELMLDDIVISGRRPDLCRCDCIGRKCFGQRGSADR